MVNNGRNFSSNSGAGGTPTPQEKMAMSGMGRKARPSYCKQEVSSSQAQPQPIAPPATNQESLRSPSSSPINTDDDADDDANERDDDVADDD